MQIIVLSRKADVWNVHEFQSGVPEQWFSAQGDVATHPILTEHMETFLVSTTWGLVPLAHQVASKPGLLLNIFQCTVSPPQQRITQTKMSEAPQLSNCGIV